MIVVLTISAVLAGAFLAVLYLLVRKTALAGGDLPLNADWIDELSVERYRPMMRLLDDRDLEFLRAQPGFTPRMAARLRQQRAQIFAGYLRCLSADFRRVCTAVKVLMLQSRHDRPDLASILLRHQTAFAMGVASAETRLLLYRWGLCRVDVKDLVKIFDGMRLELTSLVPANAAAAA